MKLDKEGKAADIIKTLEDELVNKDTVEGSQIIQVTIVQTENIINGSNNNVIHQAQEERVSRNVGNRLLERLAWLVGIPAGMVAIYEFLIK